MFIIHVIAKFFLYIESVYRTRHSDVVDVVFITVVIIDYYFFGLDAELLLKKNQDVLLTQFSTNVSVDSTKPKLIDISAQKELFEKSCQKHFIHKYGYTYGYT